MSVFDFLKDRESWILPGVVGTGVFGAGRWWLDGGVILSIVFAATIAYSIHRFSLREKVSKTEEVRRELERKWGDMRNELSKTSLGDPKIEEMEKKANIAKAQIDWSIAESLEDWPDRRYTLEKQNAVCFLAFGLAVEDQKGALTLLQSWSKEDGVSQRQAHMGHTAELETLEFFRHSEHVKSIWRPSPDERFDFAIEMEDEATKIVRLHAVEMKFGKIDWSEADKGRPYGASVDYKIRRQFRKYGIEDIKVDGIGFYPDPDTGNMGKESTYMTGWYIGTFPPSYIPNKGWTQIHRRDEEE